jgi:YVTN family beta-propeller protein
VVIGDIAAVGTVLMAALGLRELSVNGWSARPPLVMTAAFLAASTTTVARPDRPFLITAVGALVIYAGALARAFRRSKRDRRRELAGDDARRVASIPGVGRNPQSVVLSADGCTAYVPARGTLAVVDVQDRTVRTLIRVGRGAVDALALPDGQRVLVSVLRRGGSLAIVDTVAGRTAGAVAGIRTPRRMALSPDNVHVYVPSMSGNRLWRLDARSLEITGGCQIARRPVDVAASRDGRRLYVAAFWSNAVYVLDAHELGVLHRIPVNASPSRLALSEDGTLLYVACMEGVLVVVNTIDVAIVGRAQPTSYEGGVAVSRDRSTLYYLVDPVKGHLKILRPPVEVRDTVNIESNSPIDLAVRPDGLVCVACQDGTLGLINPTVR